MAELNANELRKGKLVQIDGRACTVIHWNIWKSDRRSRVQMRFKDLLTGRTSEATAQSDDRYTVLDSEVIDLEYSYSDGPEEVFYTPAGEEWRCATVAVEDTLKWQAESYKGVVVDGKLLTVNPPPSVIVEVAETSPPIKGVSSGTKDAKLANGIEVKVGVMVDIGDKVRIDTDTMEYRERIQG